MNVICLQEDAFYELVDSVVERLKEKHGVKENKWIRSDEVMDMLGIRSRTTLQKLRDDGWIRFSQPNKKIILYDQESVLDYIETHAKDPF